MNPNMSIVVDIDASPAIKKLMALKNQAPKKYSCKFIEPGIVSYEDSQAGKVYISKETLDKFCPQFEGKPVVMKGSHRDDVGPEQFDEEGVGIVGKVYYNEKDGWYWCDFYIWGEEAQKQADGGESVSCAYTVTETGEGGTRNQIEYDQEILNGEPKHIALVPNPRYEGAKIVLTGDIYQIDHPYLDSQSNGLSYLIDHFKGQKLYAHMNLLKGERSELAELASNLL